MGIDEEAMPSELFLDPGKGISVGSWANMLVLWQGRFAIGAQLQWENRLLFSRTSVRYQLFVFSNHFFPQQIV